MGSANYSFKKAKKMPALIKMQASNIKNSNLFPQLLLQILIYSS
ncbi:MAG: hypothetical protein JWP37_4187 [Mucilaginibacter sp.]|nr:hypothetical protein [Mucilaginibacter sp.]